MQNYKILPIRLNHCGLSGETKMSNFLPHNFHDATLKS